MPGLRSTLAGLARNRSALEGKIAEALRAAQLPLPRAASSAPTLRETVDFGTNPGRLRMFSCAPAGPLAPLVVVLHGCTQTAAGYDRGAGWSALAQDHGFAVLAPEQVSGNNPNGCFSWFQPGDTKRDQGEALSIRQMIERMAFDHAIDRGRIFVTGLSAGGAMASSLLAAYPDVFAGGAVIAGLPHGSAANVQQAFGAMSAPAARGPRQWGDAVRLASPHKGAFPRVMIWHGDADRTVAPGNASASVAQWLDVHGIAQAAAQTTRAGGLERTAYQGPQGVLVESISVLGMGHGVPIARTGEGAGVPGPFVLDVGVSSTAEIARFWGLLDTPRPREKVAARKTKSLLEALLAR